MLDPFIGWLAKEVFFQEAFSLALDLLGHRSWRRRLAGQVRRQTGTWITGWRMRRWLGRQATWDALVYPSPEHAEQLIATLAAAARPRVVVFAPARYTQEALRGEATRVAAATTEQFVAALEASQAVAVVDRRHQLHGARTDRQHEQLSVQLAGNHEAVLERLDADRDVAERLARLPPAVREPLRMLDELDHPAAVRLAGWLTVPAGTDGDPERVVHELSTDPPPALLAAPPVAWVMLAAYAHSHELTAQASALFERAAEEGVPDRARWLAMAAYTAANQDEPRTRALVARASGLAAGRHLVVEAVGWTLERADDRLAALETELGSAGALLEQPLVAHLVAEAFVRRRELGRAVSLYTRLLERHPERAGIALRLAELLAGRSVLGLGGRRTADLRDARQAATQALELRRRFGADARQTLAYVCELAVADSDHATVLRFGLPPPRGTATPAEADDASVLRHTAAAAMQLGEVPLAQGLAGRLPGRFDRAILPAQLLHQAGHDDQARAAYERAWPLAETVVDQRDVQLGLAELGVCPLPDHAELERDPDELAAYILALSEAVRGDAASAVRRLRPWQARSPHCAELLARLHDTAGEVDEAVAALEDAGLRTGTPRLLVDAAEVLFVHERDADLERLAGRALAHTREGTNERLRLRLLLVAAAQRRQAWPLMAERARALLEEDPADPQARWLPVTALYNQRLAEQAWQVLSEGDALMPRIPGEALAWVQLHGRFQPSLAWFEAGLRLAAEHAGHEQECAGILAELSQTHLDPAPPAELDAQLQAAREAFLARYPASPWLWTVPTGTTATEHIEALRPLLQPEAAARATATEQVIAGLAPYGVLAVIASRPYALALLASPAGCLPTYPAEAAVADVEREAARAALDGHVVTDASVLHLASHLQDRWPVLRGWFASVGLPVAAAEDLAHTEAALVRPPDGLMSWDLARDIPMITTPDPARYAQLHQRAAWMHRVARELRPLHWPQLSERFELADQPPAPHGDPAADLLPLAWLGPVDVAAEHGLPLWSDDLVLRKLARQEGVAAFGTVALLEVLVNEGRLAASTFDDIVLCLRRAWFVDLPDLPGHLEALTEEAGFASGPAVLAFARAALWQPIDGGLERYGAQCARVAATDPLFLGPWLHAAIQGAAAAQPGVNHRQLAEVLLARTATVAMQPAVLACLVPAARAAAEQLGAGDPLPGAVRRLVHAATLIAGPQDGLRRILALCAGLEPADRDLARHAAFDPGTTDIPRGDAQHPSHRGNARTRSAKRLL